MTNEKISIQGFCDSWQVTIDEIASLLPGKILSKEVSEWLSDTKPVPKNILRFIADMDTELHGKVNAAVNHLMNIRTEHPVLDNQIGLGDIKLICYTQLEDVIGADAVLGRLGLAGVSLHIGVTNRIAEVLRNKGVPCSVAYQGNKSSNRLN